MQKLTEVPDRKKGWRMRKRKKVSSWQRGTDFRSFRQWPAWQHRAVWCLGTTHTSLDVALVSPFHPVAVLSLVSIILKYTRPTNELQTNPDRTLTNFKKKLTLLEARNTKWGQIHTWNDLTYFWHLNWGIQPFQCIQEKTSSSMEWLLNPVNKGKYKRNVFVSYLLLSFLLYNSFGTFLGKALHRPVNVGVK